jgi:ABC-type glycerol-3-phosphate transport system substrate-binding protein
LKNRLKIWFQFLSVKKIVGSSIILMLVLFVVLSFFQRQKLDDIVDTSTLLVSETALTSSQYNLPLYRNWLDNIDATLVKQLPGSLDVNQYQGQIIGDDFLTYSEILKNDDYDHVYAVDFEQELNITFSNVTQAGLYYLDINYLLADNNVDAVQYQIKINGNSPYYEAQTLILPSLWVFEQETFTLDRYDNDIQPRSLREVKWQNTVIQDYKGMYNEPFLFYIESDDVMTISYVNSRFLVSEIRFTEYEAPISYESYLDYYTNAVKHDTIVQVSARDMAVRNDPSIRLRVEQDPSNLYYSTQQLRLNTIFGDSWESGGQSITYEVEVEEAGLYQLSFKYRQYLLKDLPVFRNIRINGVLPYEEMQSVSFPHTMSFINRTLLHEEDEPYYVYLNAGVNSISLESTSQPYAQTIENLKYIMNEIQELSLAIKRYTSGATDRYRDWDIELYFPNAVSDIRSWVVILEAMYDDLLSVASSSNPSEIANMIVSINRLNDIANDINSLPSKMVQFSDGDSSVNQMLGQMVSQLMRSNLELERIIVHGDVSLPRPYATIFTSVFEGTKRLVLSFVNNPYSVNNSDEDLNVWVNYPRQYIEIMQIMIDQSFNGDRKVTLSQMPDQNKLILSNTSGKSPDVAIGVDHWIPYEFSIRGAAVDLRQFEGYEEVVSRFSKGALIPYAFEDGMYGLPSTQNFWVTFYRNDILNSIGVETIPNTWDDVIDSLPLLQSYGLNYFVPLAQFSGLKPFVATIPYVYQFGGNLYTENGMQTGINSTETLEGMELMSELFTLYNVPKFVGNFFNSFRYGTLPIGIGDLSTYILLNSAADELDGLWSMAPHPGVLDPETNIVNRYASVGAQSNMILSQSTYQDEAWAFLDWWSSTEVQAEFALTLLSTYGKQYFWNTANLEAFNLIPMPRQHKEVIQAQWEYAIEAPRIPGSYMVEREMSNAWTNIVFNGVNPRQALDEAVRIANREILYKMAEFGYVVNGQPIKDYVVPSIHNIDDWLKEHAHD